MTSYYAYDHGLPCRNPSCKSHGIPHPNCRCYSGMAKGGSVDHFCSQMRPHEKGCEYYAEGGAVQSQEAPAADHPATTLGHAAVHHGLIGLLKSVGRANLADHDRHIPILEDAKLQHESRKNQTGEEFKKTLGHRLGTHASENDHEKMAERLQGHPLVGGIGKGHLEPILKRLTPEILEKESNPAALRGAVDYLHSAIKGDVKLGAGLQAMLGGKGESREPDKDSREKLKEFLDEAKGDPSKLLDVGGDLSHYLPEHGAGLGATAAAAVDYLNGLRPTPNQPNPLDEPTPPDKMAEAKYHRAIDIANQPLLVLQHIKDGTLLPSDINALKTIFPALHEGMVSRVGERLIEAKSKGTEIPYRQKVAMGLFLGQPLDFTQTPQAMQAIIRSAAPQQAQNQAEEHAKASEAELKQASKVDSLYELPNERRQIDKKS